MRPFLAAAGQYPHSPLGIQFPSSSLSHPRTPGLNDTTFKPLWKLWRLFREERNVRVFNDYNSKNVFSASPDTGHYLMLSPDSKRALLIVSNFKDSANEITCKVNWRKVGFNPASASAWKLMPTESAPGKALRQDPLTTSYSLGLGAYDVAALFFAIGMETDPVIADYEKAYPKLTKENHEHLDYVAAQKAMRYAPVPHKKLFAKISVAPTKYPYEFSMMYDLFLNTMELVEFPHKGNSKHIAWITKNGLSQTKPKPDDYVWPGTETPWLPLHDYLNKGEHLLGIRSLHYGKPFYTFLALELAAESVDDPAPQKIQFVNELEPDREYLRWKSVIA
jgi:hypothetical protein